MIELGSEVKDKVTGLPGMVTHMEIDMGGQVHYLFQPRGLNADTGQPVKRTWVPQARLDNYVEVVDVEMPTHVLGTEVEDIASGFKGVASSVVLHISGCVHVQVQPQGVLKTGEKVDPMDFDIRRLKGDALKPMTKEEIQADQAVKPSPCEIECFSPRMPE